jgi:hypothetical protein
MTQNEIIVALKTRLVAELTGYLVVDTSGNTCVYDIPTETMVAYLMLLQVQSLAVQPNP